ncbi:HAD family hydrolase [Sulfurimonas sp.]|uniref:HAD family hydrolase n=1 Tax=Sulfurimonas sp. TaxID=2022749 RepID=UPI00260CACD0|nr:HAD family hydrolase [Sulfurimonas sp.]
MIILFDLDGTLIDSTEAILESFHNSFDLLNYPHPTDEAIKALIGHPLDVMYKELGVSKEKVWDFVDTYKEHYRKISTQKTVLLPHAREAVTLASTFAELGIVTTKTGKYSRVLMEHFGLMDKFKVLIGREDVINPKPNAEPILQALQQLNSKDKDVWMIGDTTMDLLATKNAGVNSIGVLCGYGKEEVLKYYTNILCQNAYEAIKYLEKVQRCL